MFELNTWLTFDEHAGVHWLPIKKEGNIVYMIEYVHHSKAPVFGYRRFKFDKIKWDLINEYKGTKPYIDRESSKFIIREIFSG